MMTLTPDIRPCTVSCSEKPNSSHGRRALFHGWAEIEKPNIEYGKQVGKWQTVNAVVEFEDGTVDVVAPDKLRFTDSASLFAQYGWEDENEEADVSGQAP